MPLRLPTDGASAYPPPKNKVSIRGGFSDRNGLDTVPTTMQITDFDQRTRVGMINLMKNILTAIYGKDIRSDLSQNFIRCVHANVYTKEVQYNITYGLDECMDMLAETIRGDSYHSVLSVVEYIIVRASEDINKDDPIRFFNGLFETEYVGYRFVGKMITPITGEAETETIEEALTDSSERIKEHLEKALRYISDREKPDYANSIKESISAVEAECDRIVGDEATLSDALNRLEKAGVLIHPSMKEAFKKLYGYTGDAKAIRHAGNMDGEDATYAEARFMLVACSAFINYLKLCQAE